MIDPSQALQNFAKKADVVSRTDMFCLSCNKIGSAEPHQIGLIRYAFGGVLPTRQQFQAAINRDFGPTVVIDPTSVLASKSTILAKVFSRYSLKEQTSPLQYVSNLKSILDEKPENLVVEVGDIVNFYQGSVVQGQVVGFAGPKFSIRVGNAIEAIAAEDIVDVKKAPNFFPVDQAAYDYFIQIWPPEYVKLLTVTDPKKLQEMLKR